MPTTHAYLARGRWLGSSLSFALLACRGSGPATSEGPAAACPTAWLAAPTVDETIGVPGGSTHVVVHAAASGSQIYTCTAVPGDGGVRYAWTLLGPEATLSDCRAAPLGRHFASDAGAPEWQAPDGSYVVAHKVAAFAVDGASVPWLLLSVDDRGGAAPLADARYVQRVRTSGGIAPSAACDAGRVGDREKVPYTADYFFYAP
jgi:hypothetical protein